MVLTGIPERCGIATGAASTILQDKGSQLGVTDILFLAVGFI